MKKRSTLTLQNIADELNVTKSTVSRVLNNAPAAKMVSEVTRAKILAIAAQKGYVPDVNARRLAEAKSRTMAIVLPAEDVGDPSRRVLADRSLDLVLGGAADVLRAGDYRMLLVFNDERFITRKEYLTLFRDRSIDGMMVWGARNGETYWNEAADMNIVMVNTRNGADSPFPFIGNDNTAAVYQCCRRLFAAGRRRIAYIDTYAGISISEERRAGFRNAHADAGITLTDDQLFIGNGTEPVERFLSDTKRFDALLGINDRVAAICANGLMKRGYRIPQDVMIAGGDRTDDPYMMPFVQHLPMISYRFSCDHMGALAARLLIDREAGGRSGGASILSPVIIDDYAADTVTAPQTS